jgi:hypothetical protein
MHCAAFSGKHGAAGELTAAGGGGEELQLKQEPVDPGADSSKVFPDIVFFNCSGFQIFLEIFKTKMFC